MNYRRLGEGFSKLGWLCLGGLLLGCSSSATPGADERVAELSQAVTALGCDTADCCPAGTTPIVFNDQPNQTQNTTANRCLVMLGGSDNVHASGAGTTVLAGAGDDVVQGGPGGMIRGGEGRDTIMGFSGGTVYGNAGDDTIMAANGNNFVYPGAGVDTVAGGTGNDTFVIYDLCEVSWGDRMDGSGGTNTLITPVPVAQLQALGVIISNIQNVVIQQNSCKSDCTTKPDCNDHGVCAEGASPGQMTCQCDNGFTPPDCSGCVEGSLKTSPGQCGCNLPDTDNDHDGAANCRDACPNDPAKKTSPGACGCGKAETDTDNDGTPDCIEPDCDADPKNTIPGQCGCVGDDSLQPAGTRCGDPTCTGQTTATCNGAGVCGDPNACRPDPTCFEREHGDHKYWFCTGAKTFSQATTACNVVPGRSLARITNRDESEFVARVLSSTLSGFSGNIWVGANDQSVEGAWRWSNNGSLNGLEFWTGGANGAPLSGRFANWAENQPGTGNCAQVVKGNSAGALTAADCAQVIGYVCEQPGRFAPGPVPIVDTGKHFPERFGFWPKQDPLCIPQSQADQGYTEAQVKAQIEACNAATTCTEANPAGCAACTGVATLPPPGNNCAPFEAEEQAYCQLQNVLTVDSAGNPCVAGEDCCGIVRTALVGTLSSDPARPGVIGQGFDTNSAGFTYFDDTFRGTAQPSYATGTRVTSGGNPGAALRVQVGGVNANAINNMSGGWRISLTLATRSLVAVTFDYNLSQSSQYESDEFSQVLVSLDGALWGEPFKDLVTQINGNGDGGPSIGTGWVKFERSLGMLDPGTHTLTIGAYNNRKTQADELTTLLIDNVAVERRDSDCLDGFICGQVYPDGCDACDEKNDPNNPELCTKDCRGALRCGQPLVDPTTAAGVDHACAANMFGNARCQTIEVCAGPEAEGDSDPEGADGADLGNTPFQTSEFGAPADVEQEYPADPACSNPPCSDGQQHKWCHYVVEDKLDQTPVGPDTKQGGNDSSSPVSFSFDPNISLDFNTTPLAFGQADFNLDASASFKAQVAFDLGLGVAGTVDVIDAMAALHADRCQASSGDSHLIIFGADFTPDAIQFDTANADDMTALGLTAIDPDTCRLTDIETYRNSVGRVKKAYRDAIELVRLYREFEDSQGTPDAKRFPEDFCEQVAADPPQFFGGCFPGETAARTINRFIDYYRGEADRHLLPAMELLDSKTVNLDLPLSVTPASARETQTLVQAFFPVGPIPLTLQVEAFAEYGLQGALKFKLSPNAFVAKEPGPHELAMIEAHVTPYALAGSSMFVGVGFGFNGFDLSAGVEGSITLGRIGIDNTAAAGVGVTAADDKRLFPQDIIDAAAPGVADSLQTLFPVGVAKQYEYSFLYRYGSSVLLEQILAGSIAARVRIKIAFFSKTWRKVILRFPGFGPEEFPLISGGGGTSPAESDGDNPKWGPAQMPLPFVQLDKLDENVELEGDEATLSELTRNAEEFFYDSLCHCSDVGESCYRKGDCCDETLGCLFVPGTGGQEKECGPCRSEDQPCADDSECCDQTPFCFTSPGSFDSPTCTGCLEQGDLCYLNSPEHCCDAKFGCYLKDGWSVGQCRYCIELTDDIPCTVNTDCCSNQCNIPQGETIGTCVPEPPV